MEAYSDLKKKFIATSVLAAIGLAILAGLGVFVWSRETEVEQLMKIVAAGDRPDATWAFEKLKEVSRERLDEFLPYLSSTRPIPLEDMAATFPDGPLFNGGIRARARPGSFRRSHSSSSRHGSRETLK